MNKLQEELNRLNILIDKPEYKLGVKWLATSIDQALDAFEKKRIYYMEVTKLNTENIVECAIELKCEKL